MKKALLLSVLSFAFVAPVAAADWGYLGLEAAHKWGDLKPEYAACKTGLSQSPINIDRYMQVDLPAINPTYVPSPLEVANDGHTVIVNYAPGSGFNVNGKAYELMGVHFHTPSEHYIDGAPYPMEAQFLHKAEDGTLGVVAVMMKVGAANPSIEGIWQNVPAVGEVKSVSGVEINAANLMPETLSYYTYEGSLTTPPCREKVQWFVLKDSIELSTTQLTAFQAVFPVNARPIQPIGARVVQGD